MLGNTERVKGTAIPAKLAYACRSQTNSDSVSTNCQRGVERFWKVARNMLHASHQASLLQPMCTHTQAMLLDHQHAWTYVSN